jgi:hypothetical protein
MLQWIAQQPLVKEEWQNLSSFKIAAMDYPAAVR